MEEKNSNIEFEFDSKDVIVPASSEIIDEKKWQTKNRYRYQIMSIKRLIKLMNEAETCLKNRLDQVENNHVEDNRYLLTLNYLVSEIYHEFINLQHQKVMGENSLGPTDEIISPKKVPNLDIKVWAKEDHVIVRTPYLPSRNNRNPDSPFHWTIRLFRDEVHHQLSEIQQQLPHFSQINIAVLSIYGDEKRNPPDNDNLETKSIVDSIAGFFGGDGPFNCNFLLTSARSHSIKGGIYFIVTDRFFDPPSQNYLLEIVQSR